MERLKREILISCTTCTSYPTGKKKGQPLSETSSSDEEDESEGTDESNADVKPFAGARPDNESGSQQDEDEFIVEDDDEEKVELPMEFSMNTHQDLTHHFKIVCQLFVHLAVEPAHRREAFMKQATARASFSVEYCNMQ